MSVRESWSYDKVGRFDRNGNRWHFVRRDESDSAVPYEERPFEIYFRNDSRSEFGVLRFKHLKDNPYRDYMTIITKIMHDTEFRKSLLDPQSKLIAGILTRRDLLDPGKDGAARLESLIRQAPRVVYDDNTLRDAADHMVNHDIGRLPVVSRDDPRHILGYLSRGAILKARRHRIDEEHTREQGWLGRLRNNSVTTGQ